MKAHRQIVELKASRSMNWRGIGVALHHVLKPATFVWVTK